MSLSPGITERLARARADLRMGVPVVLDHAGEGLLAAAAETLGADRWRALLAMGQPLTLAVTSRRAATLKARAYDGDVARIEVPQGADLKWVAQVADPADDLIAPMKGPFTTRRDGSAEPHRAAIALLKGARLLPAAVTAPIGGDAAGFARNHDLIRISLDQIDDTAALLNEVVSARVPLGAATDTRLHVYRPEDGSEEHYAIEIGQPDRSAPVLARLHSACFTGDLLGSLKCDCGPQLRGALAQMGAEGAGVLLYLNQEGRGIGLVNKMRAYSLQDQGFDTVQANHRLGFEDDERDFRIGTAILQKMGFGAVRLMTNNPAKVAMMEAQGIKVVQRVPLKLGQNPLNKDYLATKAAKSGHLL